MDSSPDYPEPLKVAFDVKRLVISIQYRLEVFGITRYTRRLFDEMRHAATMTLLPVVYADSRDLLSPAFSRAASLLEKQMGMHIQRSWQVRPGGGVCEFLIEKIQKAPGGIRGTQRMVAALSGFAYRRSGFPKDFASDIYHSPFHPLPPTGTTGSSTRFITIHDLIYLKYPMWGARANQTAQEIIHSIQPARDHIICVSEATRADVLSSIPIASERTYVVPLAADKEFFTPDAGTAKKILDALDIEAGEYVIALGQADPRKNIPGLLAAFKTLVETPHYSDKKLLFVCPHYYKAALEKMLKEIEIPTGAVRILVDIDDNKLAGLFSLAAMFVFPSFYEGFGFPALEAMAAGCPVIVSNNSSLPEIVGEAGLTIDPHDISSIAGSMRAYFDSEELREKHIHLGLKQARGYTWEKTCAQTESCFLNARRTS